MPGPSHLKLALELVARVVGREELAALLTELQALGPGSEQAAAATATLTAAQAALQQSLPESGEQLARSGSQWQGWGEQLAAVLATLSQLESGSQRSVEALVGGQAQVRQATGQSADGVAKLASAAETLGLDFERANGRIGASFQKTLGALDTLVQHTGSSSAACEEYLAAAFNQAKNKAEVDAVVARMQAMTRQGQLTGEGISRAMTIAADAMSKVKGGSSEAKQAVAAIGEGFETAAAKARSSTEVMASGLRRVKEQADQTGAAVASAGGSGAGGRGSTRTETVGGFFYKSVDLNGLRGNAEALANTLAGVEEELARYRQKVKDIPAYSEWSKYYGEKFQKEMEAMRAQLKAELAKAQAAQAKEAEKAADRAAPLGPSTPSQSVAGLGQPQRIIIELRAGPARAEVQADEANAQAFISLLKQQGLRS